MNLPRWLRFAAVVSAFPAACFAQLTALEGDIRDAAGKLTPNAEVRIARLDANRVYPTKSDKKGHYFYSGMPAGLYSITVQIDGRPVGGVNGIYTRQGTPLTVDIYLGDTPEQQADRAKQQVRKMLGEWSYIKPMIIAGVSPPPGSPPAQAGAQSSQAAPAGGVDANRRAELLKQHQSLNDAFKAGVAALDDKRYADAIALFKKALDADPKQALVWANMASAYVKLSGMETGPESAAALQQGIDAYAKSIELKPDDAMVHNNYALALARAGRFAEMRAEIERCAALDKPNAYHAYYNLGTALSNGGHTEEAAAAFKMAMDVSPNEPGNSEAYYEYAMMLMNKAEAGSDGKISPPAGTVEALRKYIQLAPQGPNAPAAKELLAALGKK